MEESRWKHLPSLYRPGNRSARCPKITIIYVFRGEGQVFSTFPENLI